LNAIVIERFRLSPAAIETASRHAWPIVSLTFGDMAQVVAKLTRK
jgi:hypothetical protein